MNQTGRISAAPRTQRAPVPAFCRSKQLLYSIICVILCICSSLLEDGRLTNCPSAGASTACRPIKPHSI